MTERSLEKGYEDLQKDKALELINNFDNQNMTIGQINVPILPIEIMQSKSDLYGARWKGKFYDSEIIQKEILLLDAKSGGHQWLLGDRLKYIKDNKIFKKFGSSSFADFIRKSDYSKSHIYNCINIRECFDYKHACILGSKLGLISSVNFDLINNEDDQMDFIIEMSELTFEDIQGLINSGKIKEKIDYYAGNVDSDKEMENIQSNPELITTTQNESGSFEPVTVNLKESVVTVPSKLKDDEPYFSPTNQKKIDSKSYQLQMGFDNEILQKYFSKYIKSNQKEIKSWIEEELSKPKNKEDYEAYKDSL